MQKKIRRFLVHLIISLVFMKSVVYLVIGQTIFVVGISLCRGNKIYIYEFLVKTVKYSLMLEGLC